MKHLKEVKGFRTVIHIGDGATDLEACPPADGFIGNNQFLLITNKQVFICIFPDLTTTFRC